MRHTKKNTRGSTTSKKNLQFQQSGLEEKLELCIYRPLGLVRSRFPMQQSVYTNVQQLSGQEKDQSRLTGRHPRGEELEYTLFKGELAEKKNNLKREKRLPQ